MRRLSLLALIGMAVFSIIALMLEYYSGRPLAFQHFMFYCVVTFFCIGILFGNLNSMAMEPLGHIAGIGAAIIGAISTVISVVLGSFIGQMINHDIRPLLFGFLGMSLLTMAVFAWVKHQTSGE